MDTNGTPADAWPFREARLGETLIDWEPTVQQTTRFGQWRVDPLTAVVTVMTPQRNVEPNIMFHTGYQHDVDDLYTCNFAGDDCWKVRVHPKIESISHNTGYTTGGQLLNLFGYGLNGTDVNVLVDGVPCDVKNASVNALSCVTRATSNESFSGY